MTRTRTVLLGAVVLFFYLAMEWLFMVTKPSFTAMLSPLDRVGLLATSFVLVGVPFLSLVALVTLVSRRAAIGVIAILLGCLLFLMVDNFLYTVLDQGTLGSPASLRIVGTALFLALVWLSYRQLRKVELERTAGVYVLLVLLGVLFLVRIGGAMARGVVRAVPSGASIGATADRPNVVFLGIDGVEASLLSIYENPYDTTPFLRTTADEWTIFENAFPDTGKTTGSTTALLSGRSPLDTHVGFPPQVLLGANSYLHLPALLRRRGYRGFQHAIRYYADAFDLNHRDSFTEVNGRTRALARFDDTAFVHWLNDDLFFLATLEERLAKRLRYIFFQEDMINHFLIAQANQGLSFEYDLAGVESFERFVSEGDAPFYAHLHFLSTHCCQHNPRSHELSPSDFDTPDPRQAKLAADRMNAIRDMDALIERVYRFLAERGLLENTILVVYSDHSYQWDTVWRVPLLVRFPGGAHAGRRPENVLLSEVPGLLTEALGIDRPAWMTPGPGLDARPESADDETARKPGPPLVAISAFQYQRFALGAGGLSRIDEAGPPNYGIGALSMVVCSRWFKASLPTKTIATGRVVSHTAPCPDEAYLDRSEILERFEATMAEHGLTWGR